MVLMSQDRTADYQVQEYTQYNGFWLPKTVHCSVEARNRFHVDQKWTLADVSKAAP